ncbi:hypothetical protein ADUPG1_012307 [Aduncisulcus paluster]|uniref:Uncharacterized protein n=1 Tax=Aduncisulcus paluster TaxID=2918883 RepID=A0ABQ5K178_9EUKA|nr:hypothetical protein ADUPG1_012307 [Aduncisulcus paluster]
MGCIPSKTEKTENNIEPKKVCTVGDDSSEPIPQKEKSLEIDESSSEGEIEEPKTPQKVSVISNKTSIMVESVDTPKSETQRKEPVVELFLDKSSPKTPEKGEIAMEITVQKQEPKTPKPLPPGVFKPSSTSFGLVVDQSHPSEGLERTPEIEGEK